MLLSGLRLVLRKVMEQHREHVHTVQYDVKVGFYPRDTRILILTVAGVGEAEGAI